MRWKDMVTQEDWMGVTQYKPDAEKEKNKKVNNPV
jgi:hypothetical protein